MKAYDMIQKKELEVTPKSLIEMMIHDRQVDLVFNEIRTDADGYLSWDSENWTCVDGKRFIRCYMLKDRVLRDSTSHNIYDMDNDFHPEQASGVKIN
ncbi:hypothetical protein SDC9_143971 [bioreactor metagenome]|uniref:Uncharacterized protein n=1 Tax=bioreactor metagenome TaxID=1076179 RepID=A0A645E5L8_9ZZZZ